MKKYLLLFASFLALWAGSIISVHADDLQNISLDYCNATGNILHYTLQTDTQTGICYTLSNTSDHAFIVKVNFIDGTFTNDQRQNRACLDESSKENFWQYVTGYEQSVTLSGGENKTETALLQYPQGSDGRYHGCLTYSIISAWPSSTGGNTNFTILMRKAKFIDVLVGHPENMTWWIILESFSSASGANLSSNPKIRIYQDPADNKYVIQTTIKNVGSMQENVVITGTATNILMYRQTFSQSRTILKGEEFIINQKLDSIPNYDLKVDMQVAFTPFIDGLSGVNIQTSHLSETTHIFIFNIITYVTIAWLLLLLIIIILLIRAATKKKKSQTPETPVTIGPNIQPSWPTTTSSSVIIWENLPTSWITTPPIVQPQVNVTTPPTP